MENYISSNRIDKASLIGLSYFKEDVLETTYEKKERSRKLSRALLLGNIYKTHVTIRFKSGTNIILETEATVWAVTEYHIVLKSNIMIPIRCIIDIHGV